MVAHRASPVLSMLELSAAARGVSEQDHLRDAALRLQREACRLTRATDALLVTFDWQRGIAWTVEGIVTSIVVRDLVRQVAGSGRRAVLNTSLVEPIGGPPCRAVLCLRRPADQRFEDGDVALVAALVGAVAAPFARLIERP